jgi:hypothetical protein
VGRGGRRQKAEGPYTELLMEELVAVGEARPTPSRPCSTTAGKKRRVPPASVRTRRTISGDTLQRMHEHTLGGPGLASTR